MAQMRASLGLPRPTPVVLATLIVLVVAYFVSALAVRFTANGADVISQLVILDPQRVIEQFHVWTLASYALLHSVSDPQHLLFNCLGIYFFGPTLEARWGTARFLVFMAATVVTGGLFVVAAYLLGLSAYAAMGASAFALGLTVAFGLTYPDREVLLYFFPVKAIAFVYLAVGMTILDAVSLSSTSVAAHIGGMVAAALLVKGLWRQGRMMLEWDSLLVKLRIRKPPRLTVVPRTPRGPDKYIQ